MKILTYAGFAAGLVLAGVQWTSMAADVFAGTIAAAGDWVATPDGRRVCQLTETLQHGAVMYPGFCMNWQPPFNKVQHGQMLPFNEGWIRRDKPGWQSRWGTMQIHIEGKGWVP